MKSRRKPTQERAVASRAKIIDGAKRLLGEQGFPEFSMRNLARASGVGLGTIYDYFPSWKDIVSVLLEERFELRQEILSSTLSEVSYEQGLAVFVPAYLRRLADRGFWCAYDTHLRDAASADPDLSELFDGQEDQIAQRYAAEMRLAGSEWSQPALMQMAQTNMTVSHMIASDIEREHEARDLQLRLVANMILANLKMALRSEKNKKNAG